MTQRIEAPDGRDTRSRPDMFRFETSESGAMRLWTMDENYRPVSGRMRISRSELVAMGDELIRSWQNEIGLKTGPTSLQVSVNQARDQALAQRVAFAAAGNDVFRQLLDAMDDPIRTKFLSTFTDFIGKPGRSMMFVMDFLFPWRLLYVPPEDPLRVVSDDDPPETVTPLSFLGCAGIVDQVPLSDDPIPLEGSGYLARIGIHDELRGLPGGEAQLVATFQASATLKPEFTRTEKELAKSISDDGSQVIYLFCHGQFAPATGGRLVQDLIFRKNKALTINELGRRLRGSLGSDGQFSTAPIVLINACQGGVYRGQSPHTVGEILLHFGAQATLAPIVDMPIKFGGLFGTKVLEELIRGNFLGDALREATLRFVQDDSNLLGLAYASVNGRSARIPQSRV